MAWLIRTILFALPFLIPVLILGYVRWRPLTWPAQNLWLRIAFALYSLGLLLFAANAWSVGVPMEFFAAFYGTAVDKTALILAGYAAQGLAAAALLLVINWRTVRLFSMRPDSDEAKAEAARMGSKGIPKAGASAEKENEAEKPAREEDGADSASGGR